MINSYIVPLMSKPVLISLIITVLAVLWVMSGMVFPSAPKGEQVPAQRDNAQETAVKPAFKVRTAESVAVPVTDFATVTGRSEAFRTVELASEIEAKVEEILVQEGAKVTKGQVLAKLEVSDRAARVEEMRQSLNQRQIEYNAAKSLKLKGFSSDIRLAETRAALEAAQAALTAAQKTLADTQIIAPFDGMINDQLVETGDYVSRGDPLLVLVQLDPIEINGFVSERNILNIKEGSIAKATFLDGKTVEGPVTFIAPAANPDTRTFRVKVEAPNADLSIRGGLTAELKIPLSNRMAHKIAASMLSLNDAGVLGVKYLDDQNIVRFQEVEMISSGQDGVMVGGLPERMRLITVGGEFIANGQPVDSEK